jgi:hypothetical protein
MLKDMELSQLQGIIDAAKILCEHGSGGSIKAEAEI